MTRTETALQNLKSAGKPATPANVAQEVQYLRDATERAYREAGLQRGFLRKIA